LYLEIVAKKKQERRAFGVFDSSNGGCQITFHRYLARIIHGQRNN
jgi:hypothetical protein